VIIVKIGLIKIFLIIQKEMAKKSTGRGKGCANTKKGCIVKQGGKWVILNNKKGGVWRSCKSREHCKKMLDAYHANK